MYNMFSYYFVKLPEGGGGKKNCENFIWQIP